jgi:hypothetical protein
MDKFNIQGFHKPFLAYYCIQIFASLALISHLARPFSLWADITAAVFRVKVIPFWYLGNHLVSPFSTKKGWPRRAKNSSITTDLVLVDGAPNPTAARTVVSIVPFSQ